MDATKKKTLSYKNKKLKTTLSNPFIIEWPSVDKNDKQNIVDNLKILLNSAEVRMNIKDFCIVGFNAVMRALEKLQVTVVFVNGDAKPLSLVQSFIPICTLRSIPIFTVDNLPEFIGVKKCLALAITRNSTNPENPFYNLFNQCYQAFGLNPAENMLAKEELLPPVDKSLFKQESENMKDKKKNKEGEDLISLLPESLFRLRRTSKKVRVFHPPGVVKDSLTPATSSPSADVILFSQSQSFSEPAPDKARTESRTNQSRYWNRNESEIVSSHKKRQASPIYVETQIKRIKKNEKRLSKEQKKGKKNNKLKTAAM